MSLMDFCHLTSFVHDDSAIYYYYRICITSLYILTPEIIIFSDSKNPLIFAAVSTLYCAGAAMAVEHGKSM